MTRMDSDGNGSLSQEEFVQGVLKVTASFSASFASDFRMPSHTPFHFAIQP